MAFAIGTTMDDGVGHLLQDAGGNGGAVKVN